MFFRPTKAYIRQMSFRSLKPLLEAQVHEMQGRLDTMNEEATKVN
jgi:hypothetical protein